MSRSTSSSGHRIACKLDDFIEPKRYKEITLQTASTLIDGTQQFCLVATDERTYGIPGGSPRFALNQPPQVGRREISADRLEGGNGHLRRGG